MAITLKTIAGIDSEGSSHWMQRSSEDFKYLVGPSMSHVWQIGPTYPIAHMLSIPPHKFNLK